MINSYAPECPDCHVPLRQESVKMWSDYRLVDYPVFRCPVCHAGWYLTPAAERRDREPKPAKEASRE